MTNPRLNLDPDCVARAVYELRMARLYRAYDVAHCALRLRHALANRR